MSPLNSETVIVADCYGVRHPLVNDETWIAEFMLRIALDYRVSAYRRLTIAAELHHVFREEVAHQVRSARLDRRRIRQPPLTNLMDVIWSRRGGDEDRSGDDQQTRPPAAQQLHDLPFCIDDGYASGGTALMSKRPQW